MNIMNVQEDDLIQASQSFSVKKLKDAFRSDDAHLPIKVYKSNVFCCQDNVKWEAPVMSLGSQIPIAIDGYQIANIVLYLHAGSINLGDIMLHCSGDVDKFVKASGDKAVLTNTLVSLAEFLGKKAKQQMTKSETIQVKKGAATADAVL